jgi:hypothetical protein
MILACLTRLVKSRLGQADRTFNCTPLRLFPCHGLSVIAGIVDIGDKFITSDNDMSLSLVINLSPLATTPVNRVYWVSMDVSFHGSLIETIRGRV